MVIGQSSRDLVARVSAGIQSTLLGKMAAKVPNIRKGISPNVTVDVVGAMDGIADEQVRFLPHLTAILLVSSAIVFLRAFFTARTETHALLIDDVTYVSFGAPCGGSEQREQMKYPNHVRL